MKHPNKEIMQQLIDYTLKNSGVEERDVLLLKMIKSSLKQFLLLRNIKILLRMEK